MKRITLLILLLALPVYAVAGDTDAVEKALDSYIEKWIRYAPGSPGAPSPNDLYILFQAKYAIMRIKSGKTEPEKVNQEKIEEAPSFPPQVNIELRPEADKFELLPPIPVPVAKAAAAPRPHPPAVQISKPLTQEQIEEKKRKWKEWKMRRMYEWNKR